MKKNLILLSSSCGMLLLASCATEFEIASTDVPANLMTAFQAKYPDVKNPEWEVQKEKGPLCFEAEWKVGKKEKHAYFKPDGTFLSEE